MHSRPAAALADVQARLLAQDMLPMSEMRAANCACIRRRVTALPGLQTIQMHLCHQAESLQVAVRAVAWNQLRALREQE